MRTSGKYILLLSFIFIIAGNKLMAGTVKGIVTDNTGEATTGAMVTLLSSDNSYNNMTGLDGSFELTGIPSGNYKLLISMMEYDTLEQDITITNNSDVVSLNKLTLKQTKDHVLEETTIVGHINGSSDASARQLEKNSTTIMNILSGRSLQLMPDITVANVLRRVSGVTVDRGESGEGRYPVIRGMDKRYNYTLINGIKIPSPDDKNRYVPMDIFPSEILQRLEVIKDLTPDMEGDAVGGVMNLVMKDAPTNFMLQAQGALGYSQMLFNSTYRSYSHGLPKQSPAEINGADYSTSYSDFSKKSFDYKTNKPLPDGQLGLTIGNRFFHNKFGVLVSGMYQSTSRNSDELFFVPNPQPDPEPNASIPELNDMQLRYYSTHEDRLAGHLKLDYRFNDNNQISFYGIAMMLNTYQTRYMVDSTSDSRKPNGVWIPGTGRTDIDYRSKTTLQSIYNGTLQGLHNIGKHLSINWTGAYSIAGQKRPDWTELSTTHLLVQNPIDGTISAPPPYLSALSYIWQHNSDKDLSGYINAHYKFLVNNQKFDLGIGGMYRHKNRENYYITYELEAPGGSQIPFTTADNTQFEFLPADNPQGTGMVDPNDYTVTENIGAAYLQLQWQPTGKWNILAGVRNEFTSDNYEQTTEPATKAGQNGTITYSDLLPSLNIKYSLTKQSAIHASYFASISRPNFYEFVPYSVSGEYFTEVGNYNLKHSKANNFDVRYELFPGSADQLLAGVFYKRIENPIEQVYTRAVGITSLTYLEPENLGTATNMGAEFVYTRYFNKFGVSFNYTYTYSNLSTIKKFYYKDATGNNTTDSITQKRPLEGQAANIGNLSLLYKDANKGIDAQLSAIYTGRHIVYVSPYYDMDYWALGTVMLDFSAEKKLGRHFAIYAKVGNLLNTPDVVKMLKQPVGDDLEQEWPVEAGQGSILVEKKHFGQTYLIGLRYNL